MERSVKMVARLWCLKVLAIALVLSGEQSDCFSTPSLHSDQRVAKSGSQNVHTLGHPKGAEYTANYITAIEDSSSQEAERGFLVATTDYNYAIFAPSLLQRGWISVTVNENQVFIVTVRNTTINSSLLGLDEEQRDFIAEVRSNFTQNLGGLKFAHYTSGSSTYLTPATRPSGSASVASLAIGQMDLRGATKYQAGQVLPQAYEAAPLAPLSFIPPTPASSSFQQIDTPAAGPAVEFAPDQMAANQLLKSNGLPPSASDFFSRSLSAKVSGNYTLAPTAANYTRRSLRHRRWRPRNPYHLSGTYATHQRRPMVARLLDGYDPARSLCSADRLGDKFNYYNLAQAPLNATLMGDVYYFDFHCNILDVYSSSVSVRQQDGVSSLYRDYNYFSYARPDLPLAINRFFLVNEQVFFVYNDGSVLVKINWMLDQTELDMVIEARQRLRLVHQWQGGAADLLAKSVRAKQRIN